MFHSEITLQAKTWTITAVGLVLSFAVAPGLAQQGAAQSDIRSLPSSANPPPDVAEMQKMAAEKIPDPPPKGQGKGNALKASATPPPDVAEMQKLAAQKIPDPPPKGQGKGKALKASATPPPDVAEMQQEAKKPIPSPPGKAKQLDLIEKISKRPGGAERVDKAKRGHKPDDAGKGQPQSPSTSLLRDVASIFIREANAGETLTIDLTPQVDSYGNHRGLYNASPRASAYFHCAMVHSGAPNNQRVYLTSGAWAALGWSCNNPYAALSIAIPTAGYYIVNVNAYAFSGLPILIRHYESGGPTIIETLAWVSGWADYPTLQYLEAGYHNFYFVLPRGGYVSRISVDSYP